MRALLAAVIAVVPVAVGLVAHSQASAPRSLV